MLPTEEHLSADGTANTDPDIEIRRLCLYRFRRRIRSDTSLRLTHNRADQRPFADADQESFERAHNASDTVSFGLSDERPHKHADDRIDSESG